jgi:hypothetical protein
MLFLTTKIKNKAIISGLEILSLSLFFSSPEKLKFLPPSRAPDGLGHLPKN